MISFKLATTAEILGNGDIAELDEALLRLSEGAASAAAEIATLDATYADALVDDDDKAADAVERRRIVCHRTIARSVLVIPRLERRRAAAEIVRLDKLAEDHRRAAGVEYRNIAKLLDDVLAANGRATEAFHAAGLDLGRAAGDRVPRVVFSGLSRASVEIYCALAEEALGMAPRRSQAYPVGIPVKVVRDNVRAYGVGVAGSYVKGDFASFEPSEAKRLVERGEAEFVNDEDAEAYPPDPRFSPAPSPDANGMHLVLFVRAARGPDGSAYRVGELASFEPPVAARLVRNGAAEWLDRAAVEPSITL